MSYNKNKEKELINWINNYGKDIKFIPIDDGSKYDLENLYWFPMWCDCEVNKIYTENIIRDGRRNIIISKNLMTSPLNLISHIILHDLYFRNKKEVLRDLGDIIIRTPNYIFTHVLLKKLFFKDPLKTFSILHGNGGKDFLVEIWNEIAKICEPIEMISSNGLDFEIIKYSNNILITLIILPPAKYFLDAYFIALMSITNKDNINEISFLYLTLEKTVGPKPILCAWDEKGRHLNYGIHIEPTKEEFINTLVNMFYK